MYNIENLVMNRFGYLFVDSLEEIGTVRAFHHVINTHNSKPIAQKLRRLPPNYHEFIETEIQKLLET